MDEYERDLATVSARVSGLLLEFEGFLRSRGVSAAGRLNMLRFLGCVEERFRRILGYGLEDLKSKGDGEGLRRVLAVLGGEVSGSSFRAYCTALRVFLRWLGREDLAGLIRTGTVRRRIPKVLLEEDVYRLVEAAETPRDRLMIQLLWETGCRPSELLNLRIGDVQFDEYSAVIYVHGKTGERRLRAFTCKPDLIRYLNDHPLRSDPKAYVFLSTGPWRRKNRITLTGLRDILRRLGVKALGRPVYPYLLRHSAFTHLSKYLTDRELMQLGGWTTPAMISVYSHLSGRDVDEKLLALHGVQPRREVIPLLEVRRCPSCDAENAPIAVYCHECGRPLAKAKPTLDDLKQLLQEPEVAKYFTRLIMERLRHETRERERETEEEARSVYGA
jgi:integrase